jgi:hypothetical protein
VKIRKLSGIPDKEPLPRKLWSMSPMRGPSGYETSTIGIRLRYLNSDKERSSDEERVLEDDIDRWEKDWDFDPGF